ncbi:MAG TPA: hypothetical protein VJ253_02185 [Dehalococcoidia bacterium]|nr:hypothetical protein [Dehalococcoidia bacterium]
MLTALIITATATALVLAAIILAVVTGWFPRLAAIAARSLAAILWPSQPRRLSRRERYELIGRLWVP